MESIIIFGDLLVEHAQLVLFGLKLHLDLVEFSELLVALRLQLLDLDVLLADLGGGLLDGPLK